MKNFWSLQVGEAIVAEEIQKHLKGNHQVFIPLNNQLKDVDLVVSNLKSKKFFTIQVKESREYTTGKANGWFTVGKKRLMSRKNMIDFYVFLIYTAKLTKTKFVHHAEFIIVPTAVLKKKSKNKKPPIDYSHYLNNFKQLK